MKCAGLPSTTAITKSTWSPPWPARTAVAPHRPRVHQGWRSHPLSGVHIPAPDHHPPERDRTHQAHRAEQEKARRGRRAAPHRITLRRKVEATLLSRPLARRTRQGSLASTRRGCPPTGHVVCAVLLALASLAQTVAELRASKDRVIQAAAAQGAAARLSAFAERARPSVSDILTLAPTRRAPSPRKTRHAGRAYAAPQAVASNPLSRAR
jgi:hypothetical protein